MSLQRVSSDALTSLQRKVTSRPKKATENLFLEIEKYLSEERYVKALWHVAGGHIAQCNEYGSLADFLLCELFPIYRTRCLMFYSCHGKPLSQLLPSNQVDVCNRVMQDALGLAARLHRLNIQTDWQDFLVRLWRFRDHSAAPFCA